MGPFCVFKDLEPNSFFGSPKLFDIIGHPRFFLRAESPPDRGTYHLLLVYTQIQMRVKPWNLAKYLAVKVRQLGLSLSNADGYSSKDFAQSTSVHWPRDYKRVQLDDEPFQILYLHGIVDGYTVAGPSSTWSACRL